MMIKIKKFLAAGIAVLAAFLTYANWGSPLGTAWLVAFLGWASLFWDSE